MTGTFSFHANAEDMCGWDWVQTGQGHGLAGRSFGQHTEMQVLGFLIPLVVWCPRHSEVLTAVSSEALVSQPSELAAGLQFLKLDLDFNLHNTSKL